MRRKLEFQADRIEAVLALNKVPARVTGGTVTPRWVRFQVLPAVGAKISKIKGLSEEVAAALDASSCRISRRGAAVAVEVPREDPKPVRLLPLFDQLSTTDEHIPPVTAVLGLAEDGAPLLIRLPSPDVAHILVAGTTGSGKTMLLQAMILSLAMANPADGHRHLNSSPRPDDSHLRMVLIDPKGHAFGLFEGLPHLARSVIWEPDEIVEVLQSLVRVMEGRGGNGRARRGEDHSHASGVLRTGPAASNRPSILVFIDELADLLMVGGKDVQRALTRLTQRGREAGIHIVAATQKPTTGVLGPLVKANFPVRLVGRVTSAEDARTASGWSGTGAERLMGRGDFLAVAEGRVIRFQAAHISPAEIQEVVAGMGSCGLGMNHRLGKASSAIASLVPSRPMSSPRPTDWLSEMFRGKA